MGGSSSENRGSEDCRGGRADWKSAGEVATTGLGVGGDGLIGEGGIGGGEEDIDAEGGEDETCTKAAAEGAGEDGFCVGIVGIFSTA